MPSTSIPVSGVSSAHHLHHHLHHHHQLVANHSSSDAHTAAMQLDFLSRTSGAPGKSPSASATHWQHSVSLPALLTGTWSPSSGSTPSWLCYYYYYAAATGDGQLLRSTSLRQAKSRLTKLQRQSLLRTANTGNTANTEDVPQSDPAFAAAVSGTSKESSTPAPLQLTAWLQQFRKHSLSSAEVNQKATSCQF